MSIAKTLAALGATPAMIAGTLVDGKLLADVEAEAKVKRNDPYKSKWERLYAMDLEDRARERHILAWAYEPVTFRIAHGSNGKRGASYTPDFLVVYLGGKIEFVEVKGFMREAARVRFLACRERYPWFSWRMVRRGKNGWEEVLL